MVTGASTADLALLLVDARAGLTEQSRRHATIAALLRIRHVIVAVNKMDLVDYAEERFDDVVRQVLELGAKVGLHEIEFIPISALNGDNVVDASANMPWYAGPPLLERLETIPVEPPAVHGARLPVQLVLRGDGGDALGRGPARRGRAEGRRRGRRAAERHPHAGRRGARRRRHRRAGRGAAERLGAAGGRGRPRARRADRRRRGRTRRRCASCARRVCWLGDRPARERDRFLLKHGTRTVPGADRHDRRPDRVRDARVARRRRAARSTTSRTSACGSAARSPPTRTSSATPPARSSSSTRPRTTRSPRA